MFGENKYIDFHTHNPDQQKYFDRTSIQVIEPGSIVPSAPFAIGKHPWSVNDILTPLELQSIKNCAKNDYCLAIGEIGLDRLYSDTFTIQVKVFEQQLKIAEELRLPVIIHCVRAFEEVLQIKTKHPSISKWAIHGFNKKSELALRLVNEGFYLSFDPIKNKKAAEVINEVPLNRIFLETDDKSYSISDVYIRTAELMNLEPSRLKEQLSKNANDFFAK